MVSRNYSIMPAYLPIYQPYVGFKLNFLHAMSPLPSGRAFEKLKNMKIINNIMAEEVTFQLVKSLASLVFGGP